MLVIVGESGSGKSTLQKNLIEKLPNYRKIITYTTRPKRRGEKDGVDYHFIPQATFDEFVKRGFFAEYNVYNDWSYGTAKADCLNDDNIVAVLTPAGLRAIMREGIKVTSVYLYVDRRSRLVNLLNRGDNIEESYRRNVSDVGQFDGVENEVDYVINNQGYKMTQEQTLECLLAIIKESKKAEEQNEGH